MDKNAKAAHRAKKARRKARLESGADEPASKPVSLAPLKFEEAIRRLAPKAK